jgi:transketolase
MKKLEIKNRHNSMRGWFAYELYKQMAKNPKIWLVVGDFGYKVFDYIQRDFPERFINTGAAEQAMMGVAVGLALEGKIPIVYTVSSFLLYRPFETIRNYVNYEKIPVKLIGSGRNRDYLDHGLCHWAEEDKQVLKVLSNIKGKWPKTKEEISGLVSDMIKSDKPWYISLKK